MAASPSSVLVIIVPCATIAVEGRAETTETARAYNGPLVYGSISR